MSVPGLAQVKNILAVHSAKGGVGKSTVAVNLALAFAARGLSVGLLDADLHGPSAALMLGNQNYPEPLAPGSNQFLPLEAHGIRFISMGNLLSKEAPLIWRGALVHRMLTQFLQDVYWQQLDLLILDLPPGTGDAIITICQAVPLLGVVAVTTPQDLSLTDTARGLATFHLMKVPILGIVENMSSFACDNCDDEVYLFGEKGGAYMAQELELKLLAEIPIQPSIGLGGDSGTPIFVSQPQSKAGQAFAQLADALAPRLSQSESQRQYHISWRKMNFLERENEPPIAAYLEGMEVRAVWQVSADELGILWPDGHKATYSAQSLRRACPCAACVEEFTGRPLLDPEKIPTELSFKEIASIGQYALAPSFSDGHRSGIYHYAKLREMKKA